MQINIDPEAIARKRIPQTTKEMEQMLQIMLDNSNEFIPRDQDTLIASGSIHADSPTTGTFGWYTTYARNLFHGKVMVDPKTKAAGFMTKGGWRSRKGVKKIVSDREYNYSTDKNPNAQKEWAEVARRKYSGVWRKMWSKLTGGG